MQKQNFRFLPSQLGKCVCSQTSNELSGEAGSKIAKWGSGTVGWPEVAAGKTEASHTLWEKGTECGGWVGGRLGCQGRKGTRELRDWNGVTRTHSHPQVRLSGEMALLLMGLEHVTSLYSRNWRSWELWLWASYFTPLWASVSRSAGCA